MAIFVLRMKSFSRGAGSKGSRATSAAAYRSGERIRDARTGAVYDHRRRQDVLHREIVLPHSLQSAGMQPHWALDRTSLWNAAEQAETRRNSRVAREFMVALPHELKAPERLALARGFARELVERYHNAVDLVIHAPRGDERNFHAHLLATTREVTVAGLSRKTALELSGTERHRQGLLRWADERLYLRVRWAALINDTFKAAHLDARVSPEYRLRDPAQEAWLPLMAYHIERRGGHSVIADRWRERHRAALDLQRLPWRAAQAAQNVAQNVAQGVAQASPSGSAREDEALRSRQRWLAYRREVQAHPERVAEREAAERQRHAERGIDLGLGL